MGRPAWKEARATLQKILSADEPVLCNNEALRKKCLVPMSNIEMLLLMTVGAYTDFFCSMHHAGNCGFIFRGPQTPVNPNWDHMIPTTPSVSLLWKRR
uniref:Fumarylacetoacetase n=1 Tax=Arundo donax TaxID=35708 RepID=A0A0A9GW01_ARUDO